jgi:hypothetical protein
MESRYTSGPGRRRHALEPHRSVLLRCGSYQMMRMFAGNTNSLFNALLPILENVLWDGAWEDSQEPLRIACRCHALA